MSAPTNFAPSSSANALPSAPINTKNGFIQNLSTNPLYVCLGSGCTADSVFNAILAPCTVANDGTGGSIAFDNYLGLVTIDGTSPSYIAWWN